MQASIYEVKADNFKVEISGTGSMRQAEGAESEDSNRPSIEQIPPKIYGGMKWILVLSFGILGLGFILLYRARVPQTVAAAARDKITAPVKAKNERRRR